MGERNPGLAAAVSALNAAGSLLNKTGYRPVSLDPDKLMEAARRRAGAGDFGDWDFQPSLQRLMAAYEAEAHLTMLGRITVRELIVSLLTNLLHMEAQRTRHPAIGDGQLAATLFIAGLPRTGTTLLHGLLAADPASRTPQTWEVMYPAQDHQASDDQLMDRCDGRLRWANRLAPGFKKIHPIAAVLPQECIAITAQVFQSIQFHTTHNVASYQDWLEQQDQALAYRFHRRLLQHLQFRRPVARWVLKAPGHLFALPGLLDEYPQARIVQTHRDPLRVMASMASLATVLRAAFSDRVDPRAIAEDWAERWGRALDHFLKARDQANPGQFLDVRYEDIEQKPMAVVEKIYDFCGWPLSDTARQRMDAFLAANPKNKHGVHRYSLSEYGLSRERELARFENYCDRFSIRTAEG
jgi:hypothetical protein